MREQIDFANSQLFQDFLRQMWSAEERSAVLVQGVLIDVHPVWAHLWTYFHTTGIDPNIDHGIIFESFLGPAQVVVGAQTSVPFDLSWHPPAWQHLLERQNKPAGGPFLVRICVRPTRPDDYRLRTLRRLAASQPFFCIVETRPIARAASTVDGGAKLTGNLRGTLGGFLKDAKGTVYGVTCAHVAPHVGDKFDVTDSNGVVLASALTTAYTSFGSLVPVDKDDLCNRQTVVAMEAGQPHGVAVDVALLELDSKHDATSIVGTIGAVDEIFASSQFGSSSAVKLHGAKCGKCSGYVGAYAAVYRVLFPNGDFHCFDHMFEVKTTSLLSSVLPPVLGTKITSSDSGTWVLRDNSAGNGNFALCGSIVAVDGVDAYACFAETMTHWAHTEHDVDLAPL